MKKKTVKKNNIIKKIAFILLMLCVLYGGGKMIWAATTPTTSVVCNDENLYQILKLRLGKKVLSEDVDAKTLNVITSEIPNVTDLDLSDSKITDLTGIENFVNLSKLDLSKNSIVNIEKLASLNELRDLNLSTNKINNITPLSDLPTLYDLNLSSNKISDVQPLGSLINLDTLNVSNNSISSASTIGTLENLTSLDISFNSSFVNINEVLMQQLVNLNVSNTAVKDIEGISNYRNLRDLNLENNKIININELFKAEQVMTEDGMKMLAKLRDLETLNIGRTVTNGINFTSVRGLIGLKKIYVNGNNMNSGHVNGIVDMPNLEYVNLNNNNIADVKNFVTKKYIDGIEVIVKVAHVNSIDLANNKIENISELGYLDNIKYLDLSGNKVKSIEPIEQFTFGDKQLNLRNQTIEMKLYEKANGENHYAILYDLLQSAKDPDSVAYFENASYTVENAIFNPGEEYQKAPYYNIILTPEEVKSNSVKVTVHGGVTDGSKISFVDGSKNTMSIDSLLFEDENLDRAIYEYLLGRLSKNSEMLRAPKIINITQMEVNNTRELDLSDHNITNLKGLSNFINLRILNLANNNISDDSEINYIKYLETLNFSNNKLNNNYTSVEKLFNLKNLDIAGNNIRDLESIDKLLKNRPKNQPINLIQLTVADNELEDISIVAKITPLQKLDISKNKVKDITVLEANTELNTLNISGNGLEDVSVLDKLIKLETLYMANNLIKDISAITYLNSITTLDISGNRIEDITPIGNIYGVKTLNMNNNKIADISSIEELYLPGGVEAKKQKVVYMLEKDSTGDIIVPLPEIFKASKNENSKVYSSKNFILENCELSEDGQSVKVNAENLEDKVATVTIDEGQADRSMFTIAHELKGTIQYSTTEKTKDNVIATITFNRAGAKILNNEGKHTYTFDKNGEFTFIFEDEYGFGGEEKAVVDWIDNEGPKATVTYSKPSTEFTNQDVVVTITTDEKIANVIDGWEFTNDEQTEMTKTYTENKDESIELKDELNNVTKVDISVQNIDKVAPTITGVEEDGQYQKDVTPQISDDNLKTVTLKKNGQVVTTYKNGDKIVGNGEYILIAVDKAGNETTVSFAIEKTTDVDDSVKSTKYEVDDTDKVINKITKDTTLDSFKGNVTVGTTYKVVNKDGKELTNSDLVGTGCKLITSTGKEYVLIVTGDLNSDGKISLSDVSKLRKHILKITLLQDEYEKAADMNSDSKTSLLDVSNMRKTILGLKK